MDSIQAYLHSAGLIRRPGALLYDWLLIIAMLYLAALGFFVFFWRTNGQTLEMRAWRLRLVNGDGHTPAPGKLQRHAL